MGRAILATVVLLVLGTAGSAAAGTEEQAAADAALAENVTSANEACKTDITAKMEWPTFKGKEAQYFDEPAMGAHCGLIVDSVRSYCARSERHQAGVAEILKSITCRYDAKATREKIDRTDATWKIKKGAVTAGYNAETREIGESLRMFHYEFTFLRNGGPGEEKYWNEKLAKDDIAEAAEACKKKIDVKIDWPKFRKTYKLEKGSEQTAEQVYQTCSGVVGTIRDWCSSSQEPRAKAARKKLGKLTCTWDPKATRSKLKRPGASHKLKGKNFVVGWNWETENPGQEVNDFFIAKFKIKDPNVASSGPCKGKSGRALLACQRGVEGAPNACYAACRKSHPSGTGLSSCRARCRK